MSFVLPPSVLWWLSQMPEDRPVSLLLRHAERPPFAPGDDGSALPITESGAVMARALGARLGARLCSLHTSPLRRCRETAAALRDGAGVTCAIVDDHALGDPGVYVVDDKLAQRTWLELGHEAVMAHLLGGEGTLPGLAEPAEAARRLIEHMLVPDHPPGLHLFVTHDSLVTATVARALRAPLEKVDWPLYLESAFFFRDAGEIVVAYRALRGSSA